MSLSLTKALFWIFFAREAYLRVLRVSSRLSSAGEMAQIIVVRELPPRAFLKIKVSLESRYGTNCLSVLEALSARISMTRPRVDKDWLILAVYLSLSLESTPVLATHSLPARSTRWMTLYLILVCEGDIWIFWTKLIETMVCERDELSFIKVAAMDLLLEPSSIFLAISS